ncbi:ATPase, T2SS/T4P/T4SS family [Paenibacillus sp. IITD108]|uniref:ATPase, T2SS/T4P/T4SS family n=1 Tax=Paenibacillus sp. IITD108 TaxID=3116649 RepID=UPI002F3FA3D8
MVALLSETKNREIPQNVLADYMKEGESSVFDGRIQMFQFKNAIELVDQWFKDRLTKAKDSKEQKKHVNQTHRATKGHPEEVEEVKTIIRQIVDEYKLHDIQPPAIYPDLVDALFHETWGNGCVSVWMEKYRTVGKCRVNGKEVRYRRPNDRVHRTHEQYESMQDVYRLIDNLTRSEDGAIMSREKPYAELQLYNGTRVVITIPPMSKHPTIVFRRNTLEQFTLQQQINLNTIASESPPIYRMLARCGTKLILTGEPGVGKSTFLLTMFMETRADLVTVTAENAWELDLKARFPDRDITEFVGDDRTMVPVVFPRTLRMDPQIYVIGEVREVEAPMYKEACANTRGLVITTMHEKNSTNVPGTLARKELRHTEGLNYRISLTDYASLIDFVLVFETDEDGETIRNVELAEIHFDPLTMGVESRKIMWYDGEKWCYSAEIDPELQKSMRKKDRIAYTEGMNALQSLSQQNPIPNEVRITRLSWGDR